MVPLSLLATLAPFLTAAEAIQEEMMAHLEEARKERRDMMKATEDCFEEILQRKRGCEETALVPAPVPHL